MIEVNKFNVNVVYGILKIFNKYYYDMIENSLCIWWKIIGMYLLNFDWGDIIIYNFMCIFRVILFFFSEFYFLVVLFFLFWK